MSLFILEQLERLLLLFFPLEPNVLLDNLCKWRGNAIEVFDEPPVETSKSRETSNFTNAFRTWPLLDCTDLLFVNLNTLCTHNKTKKHKLVGAKCSLLHVS